MGPPSSLTLFGSAGMGVANYLVPLPGRAKKSQVSHLPLVPKSFAVYNCSSQCLRLHNNYDTHVMMRVYMNLYKVY